MFKACPKAPKWDIVRPNGQDFTHWQIYSSSAPNLLKWSSNHGNGPRFMWLGPFKAWAATQTSCDQIQVCGHLTVMCLVPDIKEHWICWMALHRGTPSYRNYGLFDNTWYNMLYVTMLCAFITLYLLFVKTESLQKCHRKLALRWKGTFKCNVDLKILRTSWYVQYPVGVIS